MARAASASAPSARRNVPLMPFMPSTVGTRAGARNRPSAWPMRMLHEKKRTRMRRTHSLMLILMGLALASTAGAIPLQYPEGDLWGFPAMKDLHGQLLGKGRFGQW